MGTKVEKLQIADVIDGDTIKVMLDNKKESVRLVGGDTEESQAGGDKPVTKAGLIASEMAKKYFKNQSGGYGTVTIEFDTDDAFDVCMDKHRDNYGRLLCYIHKGGENYNLKLIREGWSPYFVKYGYSRIYHQEFAKAEVHAQVHNLVIWNPQTNAGSNSRDYKILVPWWYMRAGIVEEYRKSGMDDKPISVRLNYTSLAESASADKKVTVFCDLQAGVNKWTGGGALIYAGTKFHKFNLWIPDASSDSGQEIIRLIEKRYARMGRGYVYASGIVKLYKGIPEIELTDVEQLSDFAKNDL